MFLIEIHNLLSLLIIHTVIFYFCVSDLRFITDQWLILNQHLSMYFCFAIELNSERFAVSPCFVRVR